MIEKSGLSEDPMIGLGNRVMLPLQSRSGQISERLVIRGHSMHVTLRLAAAVVKEFYKSGPIINRNTPFPWKKIWYDLTSDFERPHTPETWCCIYHRGRVIFEHGSHHPLLDIIEQCDVKNRAEYDKAVLIAEDIFKQAGKIIKIRHDINIGVVMGVLDSKIRCGLILRAPTRTTTFNFNMEPLDKADVIDPDVGFALAADFLEAIQLAVTAGFTEALLDTKILRSTTPKAKKMKASFRRIGLLTRSIETAERLYDIRYRPEKPDFKALRDDSYESRMGVQV